MAAIEAEGLVKVYGEVRALDGVDLEVPEGSILGVLGPNGAGKTTTVRILTTLLQPDDGSARVMGLDVVADADRLRGQIGLAGQYAAVDEGLTGRENLVLFGRLYGLRRAAAHERADELLERFSLTAAATRAVSTYSGGMRRRLDLASALVARPPVLFLDEPTTGLDPRSRISLWETIEARVAGGTTVLLTTQYLDEAERLADQIVVIDHGRVIAKGTDAELKEQVGGDRLEVRLGRPEQFDDAAAALAELAVDRPSREEDGALRASVPRRDGILVDALRRLDAAGVDVADIAMHRPTLDDVFLTLTGRPAEERPSDADDEEEAA